VDPKLQVVDVVKRFGSTVAVDHVSFDVGVGEFVVLLGASGSGKSTTLNLIAGLEELTAGDIVLKGRRITDMPPNRRGMAMVFQNYALYPHITVRENLTFGLRLSRVPANEQLRRAEATARILGIEPLLERKPGQLSGGQQQRVALGRAIIREPEVFLLDEPLSNLDAKLRLQMRGELKRLHLELNSTTIYVTHDQVEAMTLADKIILLRAGRITAQGSPLDLYDHPPNLYTADFLGSPPINLVRGRFGAAGGAARFVTDGGGQLPLPSVAADLPDAATIGVRPEDIEPRAAADKTAAFAVRLIESVGADQYVHIDIAEHSTLIARRPAVERWRIGDRVTLGFRPGKVHVFHPDHEGHIATL
jgi:ABC-type sugar transport system ATPase subunit